MERDVFGRIDPTKLTVRQRRQQTLNRVHAELMFRHSPINPVPFIKDSKPFGKWMTLENPTLFEEEITNPIDEYSGDSIENSGVRRVDD